MVNLDADAAEVKTPHLEVLLHLCRDEQFVSERSSQNHVRLVPRRETAGEDLEDDAQACP